MSIKPYKKWIFGSIAIIVLIFLLSVIEMFVPYVWYLRTHITHPVNYAAKYNSESVAHIYSYIPTFKNKRLNAPLKGNCLGVPAEIAIINKSYEALETLLKRGVSMKGCKPLTVVAINKEDYRALNMLNEYGADIHEKYNGASLLDYAASKCFDKQASQKVLQYLINEGLDVNARAFYEGTQNFERRTPLYSALEAKCVKNAKLLLDSGANEKITIYGKPLKSYKNFDDLLRQAKELND